MRKFKFRLQRFLDIRKYKEREWELKLAAITGECISIENKIEENIKKIVINMKKRAMHAESIDIETFLSFENYIVRLEHENENLREELVLKELEREKIQKSYLEASKERKVLEKLKEKKEAEYYENQRKEEFKEADDITNSRYKREAV
jgi:flagellar protein FliJ